MQWEIVVIIVLAVLLAAACIGLLVLGNKYRKEKRRSREDAGFAESLPHKPCPSMSLMMSGRVGMPPGSTVVTLTPSPFNSSRSEEKKLASAAFVAL